MRKIDLETTNGLMAIGEAMAGVGFLISFLLFLVNQKNFEVVYSGASFIIGFFGIGLFLVGLVIFFVAVELRNNHTSD